MILAVSKCELNNVIEVQGVCGNNFFKLSLPTIYNLFPVVRFKHPVMLQSLEVHFLCMC